MKKHLFFIAVAAVALASCNKEIAPVEMSMKGKVITALTDSKIITKTSLGADNSVLWASSDAVTAFVGTANHTSSTTAVSEEGKVAQFAFASLDPSASVDYVVYPADPKASIADGTVTTALATLQRIVPGSFANGANLAVGEGNDDVVMKNACAFLSIKVNGDNIHSVKLIADKPLTGEVEVNCNAGDPVAVAKDGGKTANYVQLAGSFVSGNTYYFVVLPGTYNGLKMEFTDVQGRKATFTNPTTLSVGRNENLRIADISISADKWQAPIVENAINMRQSLLYPKWEGQTLGAVSAFSLETLVKFNQFDHDNVQKIYNIMGIEGVFNVRIRRDGNDGSVAGQNIIQVNAANKLTLKNEQISTGRWYHIAVTFNSGTVKVYLDGELAAESSAIGATSIDLTKAETPQTGNTSCPNMFAYGFAYDFNRWFDGQIAEMRIWNKTLSAEEINAPGHFYFVDPSSDGLFSYWTLCNPEGNYVLDATGHGNTLYGCGSSSSRPAGINWAVIPPTVECPSLTLASGSAARLDEFIGVNSGSSNVYVATVPGATLTWTINDGGDAWTASCSPDAGANFSYDAANHTITLVVPETATATRINKWEIVASKTGDEDNAPLVLTATQQCYNRYTLTAAGASSKFGYVSSEITSNNDLVDGTYDIVGYRASSDAFFFLLNTYRTPTESIWSSNMKKMTDFFGVTTLLQDLQGSSGKVNQACSAAFFDITSDGAGAFTIRPYACQNLGLGKDAEGKLCIGPEYKDTKWTFNWTGSTTRWDIKLGDLFLNVEDPHVDVTGGTGQRNITLQGGKSPQGFRLFKVGF